MGIQCSLGTQSMRVSVLLLVVVSAAVVHVQATPTKKGKSSCDDLGGECMSKKKCDGDVDKKASCDDKKDICCIATPATTKPPCSGWQCSNGQCIADPSWKCDGQSDCKDGSDESSCTAADLCKGFLCGNDTCIDSLLKCDGKKDCRDNSDETNCTPATTKPPCSGFQCANGLCTEPAWKCDGKNDCGDNSDEINCILTTPEPPCGGWQCSNGQCIDPSWKCDGQSDCKDGSDESSCTA